MGGMREGGRILEVKVNWNRRWREREEDSERKSE